MDDLHWDASGAPPYEVLCLDDDPAAGEGHRHVIAVETRDQDGGQTRWATVEVISALREGELFVVSDGNGDTAASLEPAVCAACSTMTLSVGAGGSEVAPCG